MEVCAATFSGGLYPSEWRVISLKAHVDLPESVCPMCWCTWSGCDEHPATKAPLRWVLSWAGPVMPQALQVHGAEAPSSEGYWMYPEAAGPTGQTLMQKLRLSSSCRREATHLDIWDPLGLVWCSEIPFGSLPWFATGVSNSALGPEIWGQVTKFISTVLRIMPWAAEKLRLHWLPHCELQSM